MIVVLQETSSCQAIAESSQISRGKVYKANTERTSMVQKEKICCSYLTIIAARMI